MYKIEIEKQEKNMIHFKLNKFILFFLILFIFSTNIFSFQAGENEIKKNYLQMQSTLSYAFIQTAKIALIQPKLGHPDQYEIRLEKTSPFITYFSDRPNRVTGVMSLDQFLSAWNKGIDSFKVDPPNVTVSGENEKDSNLFFILEFTHPQFSKKSNQMTYDIKFISPHPQLSKKPIVLHNPILFFDNWLPEWCPSCCCG